MHPTIVFDTSSTRLTVEKRSAGPSVADRLLGNALHPVHEVLSPFESAGTEQASQSTHPTATLALQYAPNLQGMSMGGEQATSKHNAQSGAGSKGSRQLGSKKMGRPLSYTGDPDAPHLTTEARRKIKRRIANRESARRIKQRWVEEVAALKEQLEKLGAQHEMLKARAENAEAGRAQLSKEKLLLEEAVQKHDAEKKQLEEEARLLQQTVQVDMPMFETLLSGAAPLSPPSSQLVHPPEQTQDSARSLAPKPGITPGCNLANSLELANHQLSDLFAPFAAENACRPNALTRQTTDSSRLCRLASDAMPVAAFATDVFN